MDGHRLVFELREDLVLFREAPGFVLREDQLVVLVDVEDAATSPDQLGFGSRLFLDPGRQTGGTGQVVSAAAVVDRNGHDVAPEWLAG